MRWIVAIVIAFLWTAQGIQIISAPFDVVQQIGQNLTTVHELTFVCGLSDFGNPQTYNFVTTSGETHVVVITCYAPGRNYKLTKIGYLPGYGQLQTFVICDAPNPTLANQTTNTSQPGFLPQPSPPSGEYGPPGPGPTGRRLLLSAGGTIGLSIVAGAVGGAIFGSAGCQFAGIGCNYQGQINALSTDYINLDATVAANNLAQTNMWHQMDGQLNLLNTTVQGIQNQLNSANQTLASIQVALSDQYQQSLTDEKNNAIFQKAAGIEFSNIYTILDRQSADSNATFLYLYNLFSGDIQTALQYSYNQTNNLYIQFSTFATLQAATNANAYSQFRQIVGSIQALNTLLVILYTQSTKRILMNPLVQNAIDDLPAKGLKPFLDDLGQPPQNNPLDLPSNAFTTIDTITTKYIRTRAGVPYGTVVSLALQCSSNYLANNSPVQIQFVDIMGSFNPVNCSTTVQGPNYCECWAAVTAQTCAFSPTIPATWLGDPYSNGLVYVNASGATINQCLGGSQPVPYTPTTCDPAGGNCGYNGVALTSQTTFFQFFADWCNQTTWLTYGYQVFSNRLNARSPAFPDQIPYAAAICDLDTNIFAAMQGTGSVGNNILFVITQIMGQSYQAFLSGSSVGTTLVQVIEYVNGYLPNYMTITPMTPVRTDYGTTYECLQMSFMAYTLDPLLTLWEMTFLDTEVTLTVEIDGASTNYSGLIVTNPNSGLLPAVMRFIGDPFSASIQYNTPDIISSDDNSGRRCYDYGYALVNSTDPVVAATNFNMRYWVATNGEAFNHPCGSVVAKTCYQPVVSGLCQGVSGCEGSWCIRREHWQFNGDVLNNIFTFNDNDLTSFVQATVQVPNGVPIALLGSICPIVTLLVSNSDQVLVQIYNQLQIPNEIQIVQLGACPLTSVEVIKPQTTFNYPATKCQRSSTTPQSLQFYYINETGSYSLCPSTSNLQFNNTNVVASFQGAASATLVDQVNGVLSTNIYTQLIQLNQQQVLGQIQLLNNQLASATASGVLQPPTIYTDAINFAQQAANALSFLGNNSIGTVQSITNYTQLNADIAAATALADNATANALAVFRANVAEFARLNAIGNVNVALFSNATQQLEIAIGLALNASITLSQVQLQFDAGTVAAIGAVAQAVGQINSFSFLGDITGGFVGRYVNVVLGGAEHVVSDTGAAINTVGNAIGGVLCAIGTDAQAAFNAVVGTGGCSGIPGFVECAAHSVLSGITGIITIVVMVVVAAIAAYLIYYFVDKDNKKKAKAKRLADKNKPPGAATTATAPTETKPVTTTGRHIVTVGFPAHMTRSDRPRRRDYSPVSGDDDD